MALQPGGPVEPAGEPPAVSALAAVLRSQSEDLSLYAGFLFNTLEAALPADLLRLERRGSLRQRLSGGQPPVVAAHVVVADREFTLNRDSVGAAPRASVRHRVGGVVLRTDEVDLHSWVGQLSGALVDVAQRNEGVRRGLEQLLSGGAGG